MAVAIGAQIGLYLVLRQIAVVTMPAWAHHFHHHPAPVATGAVVVGVTVVAAPAASPHDALPPFPAPPMQPVPLVPVPPLLLPGEHQDSVTP
ncbi:hypothetical protein NFI95_12080 [Acetobacteraceae bacterium KSS8]|uniref:Uncharacterized protein n=1 Tax=Endosaccharibacter trunci TaxID=2812733 RepID=A0ABT1WA98_9PROT|nr:hypothetical protein [Acetobacteraceae bacterium KSS8]